PFFFQAEAGIRDFHVTGVQTCALPIWASISSRARPFRTTWSRAAPPGQSWATSLARLSETAITRRGRPSAARKSRPNQSLASTRSEERRVGQEGRSRGERGPGRQTTAP